jgi:hypothetical protein
MNTFRKACAISLSSLMFGTPAFAACVNQQDMAALQTAGLQQRLMVAALTCNDVSSYNSFVLSHRRELQKSDATLLTFFRAHGGEAAYHTYKTHLANRSEITSLHDRRFCAHADSAFRLSEQTDSLTEVLDSQPSVDTGFDACYAREARADADRDSDRAQDRATYRGRDSASDDRDGPSNRDDRVRW